MIPRVHWVFEKDITFPFPVGPQWGAHYHNFLIDPQSANGPYNFGYTGDPFAASGFGKVERLLEYWDFYAARRIRFLAVQDQEIMHTNEDRWGKVTLNTSTTWGRPLAGNWTGHTTTRTVMGQSTMLVASVLQSRKNEV